MCLDHDSYYFIVSWCSFDWCILEFKKKQFNSSAQFLSIESKNLKLKFKIKSFISFKHFVNLNIGQAVSPPFKKITQIIKNYLNNFIHASFFLCSFGELFFLFFFLTNPQPQRCDFGATIPVELGCSFLLVAAYFLGVWEGKFVLVVFLFFIVVWIKNLRVY